MKRILLIAAAVLLGTAPSALAFGGAQLQNPRGGIGLTFNGTAFPRVFCAGGTQGFCSGTITIRRRGKVLGSAPVAIRSGDGPSIEVPLKGGRRTSILRGGRSVSVTIRTHDNLGDFRTFTQTTRLK